MAIIEGTGPSRPGDILVGQTRTQEEWDDRPVEGELYRYDGSPAGPFTIGATVYSSIRSGVILMVVSSDHVLRSQETLTMADRNYNVYSRWSDWKLEGLRVLVDEKVLDLWSITQKRWRTYFTRLSPKV